MTGMNGSFPTVGDGDKLAKSGEGDPPALNIDPECPARKPQAIVIVCELGSQSDNGLSFDMVEFVELTTGRRVVIRSGRGWGSSSNQDGNPWRLTTKSEIESTARGLWVLYEEEEAGLDWVVRELAAVGVDTKLEIVDSIPVLVELSTEVHDKLAKWGRIGPPA